MKIFIAVLVLIFSLQSWTKAEGLILKCSGVSFISEGVTKPLDFVYKKVINLDKKTTYRSDNPYIVHNIIITDNFFYEYNVEKLDFGSLLQIRSINRLNGSLTVITKNNSNFTYERLRKELNKVNIEIESQKDEKYITKKPKKYITKKNKKYITKKNKKYITKKNKKYITKKNKKYITKKNKKYITKKNKKYITKKNEKYITKKNKKYITKKNEIKNFFLSNGTTEQELKKYNIVKRNVMSILNSKTRTIAKHQCKNEAY